MTDPDQNNPPEANPYQSPGGSKGPSRIDATSPSVIRPRWWEILVFAVLLLAYLTYSPNSLVSVFRAFSFGDPEGGFMTLLYLLEAIVLIVSIVGGMIALRLWWWQMLPAGLAPGHFLMLTALFAWGTYVALGIIIGMMGEFLALSREDSGNIDYLLASAITPVLHLVLLLRMLPRFSNWFWAAAITLAAIAFLSLRRTLQTFTFNWGDGGLLPLLLIYLIGGLIAAIVLVVIAVRERKLDVRRDWLHWTGFACWLGMLVFPLARAML